VKLPLKRWFFLWVHSGNILHCDNGYKIEKKKLSVWKFCPPPFNPLLGGEIVPMIAGDTLAPRQHKHAALAIKSFRSKSF
jgi:hypothetical protein